METEEDNRIKLLQLQLQIAQANIELLNKKNQLLELERSSKETGQTNFLAKETIPQDYESSLASEELVDDASTVEILPTEPTTEDKEVKEKSSTLAELVRRNLQETTTNNDSIKLYGKLGENLIEIPPEMQICLPGQQDPTTVVPVEDAAKIPHYGEKLKPTTK